MTIAPLTSGITRVFAIGFNADLTRPMDHPVFIITQHGRKIVFKIENRLRIANPASKPEDRRSLTFISKFYGAITGRETDARAATDQEVQYLLNLPPHVFVGPNIKSPNDGTTDTLRRQDAIKTYIRDFTDSSRGIGFATVMTYFDGLIELEGLTSQHAQFNKVCQFLQSGPQSVYFLGKIAAADLIVGAGDRFNMDGTLRGGGAPTDPLGRNVFFRYDAATGTVEFIGIDYWDPNSIFADFTKNLDSLEAERGQKFVGQSRRKDVLTKERERMAFARNAVTSLETALIRTAPPGMASVIPPNQLDDYVEQFAKGIKHGWKAMKNKKLWKGIVKHGHAHANAATQAEQNQMWSAYKSRVEALS